MNCSKTYPWLRVCVRLQTLRRFSADASRAGLNKEFRENVARRLKQGERSVFVQVRSVDSCDSLLGLAEQYGPVANVFHVVSGSSGKRESLLVEFESEESCSAMLKQVAFQAPANIVPMKSPFLWMGKRVVSRTPAANCVKYVGQVSEEDLFQKLAALGSMSEQMQLLYDLTRMTEVEARLRYLICQQVRTSVELLYPTAPRVVPFGSSVNGFGKRGCDLDMVVEPCVPVTQADNGLFFQAKEGSSSSRIQTQRQLELVGDILSRLAPGCVAVQRILQARVPIVRFHHELVDVDCDVSMDPCGSFMSELLWSFGEMDDRVRPLVFTVRKWARNRGLTNPQPGKWISNFGLTALVLFYLQTEAPAVLPSVSTIRSSKTNPAKNDKALNDLLMGFFEFGGQFDFKNKAMSLVTGQSSPKPDHSPLYIENPLDQSLNVTRNVSADEVDRFIKHCRECAWAVESNHSTLPDLLLPAGNAMRFDLTSFSAGVKKFQVKNLFSLGPDPQESSYKDPKTKKGSSFKRQDHRKMVSRKAPQRR